MFFCVLENYFVGRSVPQSGEVKAGPLNSGGKLQYSDNKRRVLFWEFLSMKMIIVLLDSKNFVAALEEPTSRFLLLRCFERFKQTLEIISLSCFAFLLSSTKKIGIF
jgi:hypothetical protein